MCIVVETFLICDGGCGETFGVDMRHLTGAQHRENAKKEGWKVKDNRDYCPSCVTKLQNQKQKEQQP